LFPSISHGIDFVKVISCKVLLTGQKCNFAFVCPIGYALLFNRYSFYNPLSLSFVSSYTPPTLDERCYQFYTHFALINRLGDEKKNKSMRRLRILPTVTRKPFREISLFPNAISKTAEQENTFFSCIYTI